MSSEKKRLLWPRVFRKIFLAKTFGWTSYVKVWSVGRPARWYSRQTEQSSVRGQDLDGSEGIHWPAGSKQRNEVVNISHGHRTV